MPLPDKASRTVFTHSADFLCDFGLGGFYRPNPAMDAPDHDLLRRYADHRDEAAFAEVVHRHVDLVYATALRLLNGDTHSAQDVTQTVFTDLARHTAALRNHPTVAGWLHTSARYHASKTVRTEQRRRMREQEAVTMNEPNIAEYSWEQLRPLLDEAVGQLNEADRDALLLRYFEGKSHREVGAILNLDENTARMRVERALDKLRNRFSKRGVATTAALLATNLSAHATTAAPSVFASALAAHSLAAVGTGAAVASTGMRALLTAKSSLVMVSAGVAVLAVITLWPAKEAAQASVIRSAQSTDSLSYTPYRFTTIAGAAGMNGRADGPANSARFNLPIAVAVDSAGNLLVSDNNNSAIRKVVGGSVTTLAGNGRGKEDGAGSAARFNLPLGLTVDPSGIVYVADGSNRTIRKVTPAGVVTTFAGNAGPAGEETGLIGSDNGYGSAARFGTPWGIVMDPVGNLYVADKLNHTIREITPDGGVLTLYGTPGHAGSQDGAAGLFDGPSGLAMDQAGNLFVSDETQHTVRKITPAGVVSTLAGKPGERGSADGVGSAARFNQPLGLAADQQGNVYVADSKNNTIRRITAAGVVTTLGGLPGVSGDTDGAGNLARFSWPCGVAVDAVGNIYVTDTSNHIIRKGMLPPKK